MGIEVFEPEEIELLDNALVDLGWKLDIRLTTEAAMGMKSIAEEVIDLKDKNNLTQEKIDELACSAFDILSFQLMNVEERAFMIEGVYKESGYLGILVPLIDEALFCYYRGYFTASLAVLFIVVESYLLNLYGWSPGDIKPSFNQLQGAINNLNESNSRRKISHILSVIYSRYNAANPTQFYFNRHGLLHGMRGPLEVDRMNCARIIQFFDSACAAEGLRRSIVITDNFRNRFDAFSQCVYLGNERLVLGRI